MIQTTASTLLAVLAYIDPDNTPKIAYDRDDLALPLINKIKEAVGDSDGSMSVSLSFDDNEEDLKYQFSMICTNISSIFETIHSLTK